MAASDGGPLVEWILFLLSAPPCWVHFTTSQMSVSVFHKHDSPEGLYFSRKNLWFIHKCYVITILMLGYIKHTHTRAAHTGIYISFLSNIYICKDWNAPRKVWSHEHFIFFRQRAETCWVLSSRIKYVLIFHPAQCEPLAASYMHNVPGFTECTTILF